MSVSISPEVIKVPVPGPGIDLDIVQYGASEAPPVIVLTGGLFIEPPTAELLSNLAARSLRVLAPRLPGFGGSDPLPSPTTMSEVALALRSALAASVPGLVPVVGEALGGWAALELALVAPELVGSLTLISPVGVKLGSTTTRDFHDIYASDQGETARILYGPCAPQFADWLGAMDDAQIEHYAIAREVYAGLAWSPYLHNPMLRRWLSALVMRVDIISGAADHFARPGYYDELALALGARAHAVLPDAGHRPQFDDVERTAEIIEASVRELGARAEEPLTATGQGTGSLTTGPLTVGSSLA